MDNVCFFDVISKNNARSILPGKTLLDFNVNKFYSARIRRTLTEFALVLSPWFFLIIFT
jgi:hypothetical protein